jgi:hypothetical protein
MRLVFVNYLHPDTGLVGSVRLWRFSQELARRGHRVLLVCSSTGASDNVDGLAERIETHDWREPLVVSVRSGHDEQTSPTGGRIHGRFAKRVRTAWNLLVRGGPFWRWTENCRGHLQVISERFQPQLCYATFGNLDSLNIAQSLARSSGVPWVLDIKDPASAFLPRLLRPWLVRRYRDAAAVTMNAEFQRDRNPGWAGGLAEVVYSGVESCPEIQAPVDADRFALVGAIYDDVALGKLMGGFSQCVKRSGGRARMIYYGKETERVRAASRRSGVAGNVTCAGLVERYEMLRECGSAGAICYVSYAGTFHHKLLELAALGRPLITSPRESDEGRGLLAKYNFPLACGDDESSLAEAMWAARTRPPVQTQEMVKEMSWRSVSAQLERVLMAAKQDRSSQ